MDRTKMTEELKTILKDHGISYTGFKSLDLANQSLADDNKVVSSINMDDESGKLTVDMSWFDEDTDEEKLYPDYPVNWLDDEDLKELHSLVTFAVADCIN